MSTPSKRTVPRAGFSMPWMARISELLPAPLAPTMATISPAAISSDDAGQRLGVAVVEVEAVDLQQRRAHAHLLLAEIDVEHGLVARDLGRRALGDLLAVAHDHDLGGQRHDRAHHMLDQQDGEPGLRH